MKLHTRYENSPSLLKVTVIAVEKVLFLVLILFAVKKDVLLGGVSVINGAFVLRIRLLERPLVSDRPGRDLGDVFLDL